MNNEASEPLTGIKKLQFRLGYIGEEESSKIGLSFIPSPDDVFITTFPKCGTTWVSFILHSLRSRGNMDFCEITEVVPWTIMAHMCKQDLNGPQRYNPRLFKSHEDYNAVPKGGKYVYVVRNPPEVIVSYYEFLQNVAKMNPGDVDFREFFNEMILTKRRIWDHYLSFIEQRDNPNVLWVFYEDLLENREQCITKLAAFAGIPLDDELKGIVMQQSAFQFMKDHDDQFNDNFLFSFCYPRLNEHLPDNEKIDLAHANANKVHKGGGGKVRITIPEDIAATMESEWSRVIGEPTGIKSYTELRAQFSFLE